MKNYYLLSIFVLMTFSPCSAQNEGNWWYFGHGAGVNFNTVPPTGVNDGQIQTFEGCSAISDNNGDLLFYTDGRTIWDRNHVVMPNGDNLPGNASSTQSSLVVKDLQLADIYYIFSVDTGITKQLSKVDMTLNNGLGDVVSGFKNVDTGVMIGGERVHATINPTDRSNWVGYADDGIIKIQNIRNGLLSPTVLEYDFSHLTTMVQWDNRGALKFSPDGTRIAISAVGTQGESVLMLCDFDPTSGVVSNAQLLTHPYTDTESIYGIEFSPDSQILYADANSEPSGNFVANDKSKRLLQYDLNGPAGWQSAPFVVYEHLQASLIRGNLQLGPNNKVYYARNGTRWIGVVDKPNQLGAACNYIHDGIQLPQGAECREGLTNVATYIYNGSSAVGPQFEIQGAISYDLAGGGCSANANPYPYSIIEATFNNTATRIALDGSGNYRYGVPSGQHTLTPKPENPTFWTMTPTQATVDFPNQSSPAVQDFCMVPNGTKQDLQAILIPTSPARPGMQAAYKVIIRNVGNSVTDGIVNLIYQNDYMNLLTTNPATTSQTSNTLTWDFVGLAPFDYAEFDFVMDLNLPTDPAFPLNAGDILNYTVSVSGPLVDDVPSNNSMVLDQIVVNSFDPNDIVCLEGTSITPQEVGGFIHYMVRFENQGSADALNVVVKNQLDLSRLDPTTLIPLASSHNFTTTVGPDGMAEFTFQNISLGTTTGNNTGFLLYKVATKSNLIPSNHIDNMAEIYFDFNPAIQTNTYRTTVSTTASNREIEDRTVEIYPNPADSQITIHAENSIERISIYDLQGRLVQSDTFVNPGNQQRLQFDGDLGSGVYFVKCFTSAGISTQKLIVK